MEKFMHKNRIIRETDFREREYDRGRMRFCSVLSSNLSLTVIREEADFAGNGWISCNFCGASYIGLTMDMEQYDRCSMGGMRLERVECRETVARCCLFSGNCWSHARLYGCEFQNCDFRRMLLEESDLEDTVFRRCMFARTVFREVRMSNVVFSECSFFGCAEDFPPGGVLQNCRMLNV